MPAGTDDDNAAERSIENAFVSMLDDAAEEPYSDQYARQAAKEHESYSTIRDLFPPHLYGDDNELHDGGVDEGCSDGKRERHMQKEHEDGRCDGACSNPGDCNCKRYEKADGQFHERILIRYSD
jgi:hypothetical protein